MGIPIVFTVRKQSQRCHNKILRPFCNNKSLLQIAIEKFSNYSLVYIAAHETEFKEIALQHNVRFAERSLQSALSENTLEIHEYLKCMPYKSVCLVNVCCPLLKSESVYKAIELFKEDDQIISLFSTLQSHDLIFDNSKKLINIDKVFNSKIRKPNYIGTNAFLIFNIKTLFSTGSYWNYGLNDPYLFNTTKTESTDIDTEEDFVIAQTLYNQYGII